MSRNNKPTRPEPAREPVLEAAPIEPLKPQRGLFVILCAAFVIWVGFLTTLYFKTVHGKEDPHAHRVVDQAPEKGQ